MTDPQVPQPYYILAPFVDTIVGQRPLALAAFNGGKRYSHLYEGLRAQCARNLQRLAEEAKASRLPLAQGAALRDLAASEYETILPDAPREAVGHVLLSRSTGALAAGVFRQGDRWTKPANPTATPVAIEAAQYETLTPLFVPQGVTTAVVQIRATRTGPTGNVLQVAQLGGPLTATTLLQPATTLWDPAWTVVASFVGGGSSGVSDELLRRAAGAFSTGQFGPTKGAVVAGALRAKGVRYYAYFDTLAQNAIGQFGVGLLYVADESWGSSPTWANEVAQSIAGVQDDRAGAQVFLGFGCRIAVGYVANQFVNVTATVRLRRSQYLADTRPIDQAIKKAVRSFFDDRTDWYTFRLGTLRAEISRADRRILVCTSATVTDATTGATIAQPPAQPGALANLDSNSALVHYYLPDNGVTTTFLPPL